MMAAYQYKKAEDIIRVLDNLPRPGPIYDENTGLDYYPDSILPTGLDRTNLPTISHPDYNQVNELFNLVERSAKDVEVDFNLRQTSSDNFMFLRKMVIDKGAKT